MGRFAQSQRRGSGVRAPLWPVVAMLAYTWVPSATANWSSTFSPDGFVLELEQWYEDAWHGLAVDPVPGASRSCILPTLDPSATMIRVKVAPTQAGVVGPYTDWSQTEL